MQCRMRTLIVLDDPSEQGCEPVVSYAAGLLAEREDADIHLLLVLPPTPSEFLEFGSVDELEGEAFAGASYHAGHRQWLDATMAEAHPTMARARELLEEAGIPADSIHEHYEQSMHSRHVAQHALELARSCGCDTIALNHSHLMWYQRWLHIDPGNELLRKADGMTLWFVSGSD
jgi:nucleotide-binding universal stress UspA family protein